MIYRVHFYSPLFSIFLTCALLQKNKIEIITAPTIIPAISFPLEKSPLDKSLCRRINKTRNKTAQTQRRIFIDFPVIKLFAFVTAQIKFAVVIVDADNHAVEPAVSAEDISLKSFVVCEENIRIECKTFNG